MRPIFIGLILSSSSPALANGYKDTIEQCLAAHQSGDNSKVQLIASKIKAIKMYGDQTRIDAAKCMSHAYGGKWVYDHSAKAMIKKDTVVAELSDEEAEERRIKREQSIRDAFAEKLKAHELKLSDKNKIGFRDFYIGMDSDIFTYLKNGAVAFRKIILKNEDGKKCNRSNSKPLGDTCYGLDYKFSFSTGMKLNKIRVYVLNYVQSSSYIGNLFNIGTSEDPVVNLINSLNKKYKKSYSYSENERLLFNDGETDELYIAYEDGQVIFSLERVDDGSYDTDIYAYITYRNKSDGLKFLDAIKPKTATSDF
jgi:hypothetical protein